MSALSNFPAERIYDYVHAPHKSAVLLDRLWPRGISKAALQGVAWEKDATPSTELRHWFHEDPEGRFDEFCQRFRQELALKLLNYQRNIIYLYIQNYEIGRASCRERV